MAVTEKWTACGSPTTILSGASLQNLVTNALVLGGAFNNVQGGGGGDGYVLCRLAVTYKFQTGPTANTALSLWFIRSSDGGTTYEEGASSATASTTPGDGKTPVRAPDVTFPVSADTNAHTMMRDVWCPAGFWKPLLKNDGTGQSLTNNTTDNTLTITPYTPQGV